MKKTRRPKRKPERSYHPCMAGSCERHIPTIMPFCKPHWTMLDFSQQARLTPIVRRARIRGEMAGFLPIERETIIECLNTIEQTEQRGGEYEPEAVRNL